MKVYHRTPAAAVIQADGFKDGEGTYMTREWHRGVWVSDVPLDCNEGTKGDVVLTLDIPQEALLEWEWVESGKRYREFLMPAELLNRYGPPHVFAEPDYPLCQARLSDGSLCGAEASFFDHRRLIDVCLKHRGRGRLVKDRVRGIWWGKEPSP